MTRRFLKLLFACAASLAVPLVPAVADNAIKLRVPVQLKKMVATTAQLHCWVYDGGGTSLGGADSDLLTFPNGNFDQAVEVTVTPNQNTTFSGAKSYGCALTVYCGGRTNPKVGTPPADQPCRLAKPDEFFRIEVSGSLTEDAGNFVGGIAGPKDLAVEPKPKQ